MVEQIGKAERLLDIAEGKQINLSGPSGKTYLGYPSISDQLSAWKLILGKVMPDLQATTLDATVMGEIRTPDAAPTRNVARAVLDILRGAQMEKQPVRGPYIEADTGDDDEDNRSGASGLQDATGGEDGDGGRASSSPHSWNDELASRGSSAPADFSGARGGGGRHASAPPPHSPAKDPATMTQDELRAELIRQGVIPADEPIGVPHNPWAMKGEQPPAMTAEQKMRERDRKEVDRQRERNGMPPVNWAQHDAQRAAERAEADELMRGASEGPHQSAKELRQTATVELRPGAPGSEFNEFGNAQPVYVGDRGHHLMRDSLANGDGRQRYAVHGPDGMRLAFAWGREAAEARIRELIEQGGQAVTKQKWQRS
jgi:hypothetical protein